MLFGLAGALATFQHMMEEVLSSIPKAQAFINNISMGTPTFKKLVVILEKVFAQLAYHNLCLSQKKCVVFVNEINLLGIIVSNQGIALDPKQLVDIQHLLEP